jgi:hypothetical protein
MREILAILEVIDYTIAPNVDSVRVAAFVAAISK